jgi:hypothetical protein
MKRLLAISVLLWFTCPAWAGTWALVNNAAASSCSSSLATCAVTVTSTGTGNLLVAVGFFGNTTDNFTAGSGGGTWASGPITNCHGSDASIGKGTDILYALSSTSGTTSITLTKSGSSGAWVVRIMEYSTTAGPAVFDTCGNRDQSTTVTNPVGPTLTLGGANDVIVQGINGGAPTAISGSYTNPATFLVNNAHAGWINTSSGTAPTWTQTSSRAVLSAIAFEETAAIATQSKIGGPSVIAGPSVVH